MLKSGLCDYSDTYILLRGTLTVTPLAADGGNNGIEVLCKNCALFTDCISKRNNTQIDNVNNAKDIDVVMLTYNSIEYSDNYSKIAGSLWKYHRDEPALNNGLLANFPGNNALVKFK